MNQREYNKLYGLIRDYGWSVHLATRKLEEGPPSLYDHMFLPGHFLENSEEGRELLKYIAKLREKYNNE